MDTDKTKQVTEALETIRAQIEKDQEYVLLFLSECDKDEDKNTDETAIFSARGALRDITAKLCLANKIAIQRAGIPPSIFAKGMEFLLAEEEEREELMKKAKEGSFKTN